MGDGELHVAFVSSAALSHDLSKRGRNGEQLQDTDWSTWIGRY